jgi:predicted enzyme related to lactoylglutathione lyase
MSQQTTVAVSHIGICTADVDHSVKFYTEALGFRLDSSIEEISTPFDKLMELPGATCRVHYVTCGALKLELIGYPTVGVVGSAERRPMNQLGFTHLTLIVRDIDSVADLVVQYGGRVYPETRIDSPFGPIVFCTDPDGVRIELFQARG